MEETQNTLDLELDFSEVGENLPVPDGIYRCRIMKVEPKVSQKGNQYLNWMLSIIGCEGDLAKFNFRTAYYITMTAKGNNDKLYKMYKAVLGEKPKTTTFDPSQFIGKEVECYLKSEMQEDGSTRLYPSVLSVKGI